MNSRGDFLSQVETYSGALEWAVSFLENIKTAYPEVLEPGLFEECEARDLGLQALFSGRRSLAEEASSDFDAHRAMALGCERYIRNGLQLPEWAQEWVADFLEGKVAAPSKPSGRPSKKMLHSMICEAIDELVGANWKATRNDETKTTAACDVLAEALKKTGLQPSSFEGVKRIYLDWNREQDNLEQALGSQKVP